MRKPRVERAGSVLVMIAVGLTGLMLILALTIDVGVWYNRRAQVQLYADLAAMTSMGAMDPRATYPQQRDFVIEAAREVIKANGYDPAEWTVTPQASADGTYVARTTVVTTQALPTFFFNAISAARPIMRVRAIAESTRLGAVIPPCGYLASGTAWFNATPSRVFDSYDSKSADYSPDNLWDGARYDEASSIGCANALLDLQNGNKHFGSLFSAGQAEAHGGSLISGDITAARGVNSAGAVVGGKQNGGANVPRWVLPPVAVPADIKSKNDNTGGVWAVDKNGKAQPIAQNDKLVQMKKDKWAKITIRAGGTYYFSKIDVDVPIEIEGDPATRGKTTIYMDGDFRADSMQFTEALKGPGKGLNGVSARDLTFYGIATGAKIKLSEGMKNAGDLYAPNMDVELDGDLQWFGRLWARNINFKGRVSFTHDKSLDPAPDPNAQIIRVRLVD